MAYVSPASKPTGTLITAAAWNQDIVANEQASAPDVFEAAGDLFVGTGADVGASVPAGANDYVLIADDGQAAGVKWGQVATGGIANDAVTTAQIADDAVTDVQAGDRVPQFYRRQGGNATNWDEQGATDYTPGPVRMQAGVKRISITAGLTYLTVRVTFPVAFGGIPIVFVMGEGNFPVQIETVTTTYVDINATRYPDDQGTLTLDENWLAIGPE